MPFSCEVFQAQLHGEFGRACRYLEETTSTIDAAWEWLRAGGPHGGVVIAGRQTQGRGRSGRVWSAPEGGLWMSVLARPDLDVRLAGRLGMAMAIAVAEGVEATAAVAPELKWPNDVLLAGRKLAGVLVETQVEGGRIAAAVLSAGINVNARLADLPAQVRTTAASLRDATKMEYPLEGIAARVLHFLGEKRSALKGDGAELMSAWGARDALRGQPVSLGVGRKRVAGVYDGIEPDGAARIVVGGEVRRVSVGEITRERVSA